MHENSKRFVKTTYDKIPQEYESVGQTIQPVIKIKQRSEQVKILHSSPHTVQKFNKKIVNFHEMTFKD